MLAPSVRPARGRAPATPDVNTVELPDRIDGASYFTAVKALQ
jgi:hypothetical protein